AEELTYFLGAAHDRHGAKARQPGLATQPVASPAPFLAQHHTLESGWLAEVHGSGQHVALAALADAAPVAEEPHMGPMPSRGLQQCLPRFGGDALAIEVQMRHRSCSRFDSTPAVPRGA